MAMSRAEKIAAAKKRHGFSKINTPRRGGPKKFEVLAFPQPQTSCPGWGLYNASHTS